MSNNTYTKTSNMLMCGLFAAMTGVAACIVIPIPFTPVPMSLATLAVMVAGGVLGSRLGAISMLVYLFIGAFGVPVFSGFTGGMGRLLGPTGGFLIGYVAMAFVIGFMIERFGSKGVVIGENESLHNECVGTVAFSSNSYDSGPVDGQKEKHGEHRAFMLKYTAMALGTGICYGIGTGWFMVVTGSTLWTAVASCVLPFLIGDTVKILSAAWLVQRLRKYAR